MEYFRGCVTHTACLLRSTRFFSPCQACLEARRKEVAEDGVEDHALVVVGHVDVPDHVEVPHESRGNMSSAIQVAKSGEGSKVLRCGGVHGGRDGRGSLKMKHEILIVLPILASACSSSRGGKKLGSTEENHVLQGFARQSMARNVEPIVGQLQRLKAPIIPLHLNDSKRYEKGGQPKGKNRRVA